MVNLCNFVFLSILPLNAQHHVLEDINERFCLLGDVLIIRGGVSWLLLLGGLTHQSVVLSMPGVRYYHVLHLHR